MEKVERIDSVKQYNDSIGVETLYPLVSVVDFDKIPTYQYFRRYMGIYAIFLKNIKCGDMKYGCQNYDYEDGTLVFIAPGQIYGVDSFGEVIKPSGKALVFHPDLLLGTHLAQDIKYCTFFNYEMNEALHLSKKERDTIEDCLNNTAEEIGKNIDKYSKKLIVSTIDLLLNYCMRFYDRQFITRANINNDILIRFENLLNDFFISDKALELGFPSVTYCAEQLHLSPNYFGDLIKKETGNTALDYIQLRLIEEAKKRIVNSNDSLHTISFQLGFKYQQHFSRLFKQKVGITPNEFRNLN